MALIKEVSINTTSLGSELIADILYDISSQGVCIYDSKDLLDLIKLDKSLVVDDKTLLSYKDVKVKAYFPLDKAQSALRKLDEKLNELKKNSPFNLGSLEIVLDDIDENLWWENWKKTYKPIKINNLVIVPSWIEYKNKNEKIIKIDPNMAFGSGAHESTRMCVEFLQEMNLENKKIVDIGTGSGILAIIAAALNCKDIEAYDIDDDAVSSAKKNVRQNNFDNIIKVANSNLLENVKNKFDIVIANITSEVLKTLAKDLKQYINVNGIIIISGILTMLEDEVISAYKELGFKVLKRKNIGEWVAFMLSL